MPELPEVQTVVTELEKLSVGAEIISARVLTAKIRFDVPKNLPRNIKGRKILSVTRRAKYIMIHLDNDHCLIIHLGMSGRLHISECGETPDPKKHDHFVFCLSNGRQVTFNDPRRFGLIAYIAEEKLNDDRLFSHLGPEPLEKAFTAKFLFEALSRRKTAVKITLMDQEMVVGVGNIYACEALFECGIDPRTPSHEITEKQAAEIVKSIRTVLRAAIKAGGSTLRDYRKTNGDLGYFQHRFAVYDREGKECKGCTCDIQKTKGVQRMVQGGRSTFYCPRKQI